MLRTSSYTIYVGLPETSEEMAEPRRPSESCTNLAGGVISAKVQIGQSRSYRSSCGCTSVRSTLARQ